MKSQGWVRVDPTAAVSPLRVESGISAAVPRSDPLPLLVRAEFEALRQLRFTWDLFANTWNQWVLGYTPERQRTLLSRVGIDDATWYSLTVVMLCATVVIIVTSKVHTRRVRATWHALVEQRLRAIVRPASDRYNGAHWWRDTYDALVVSREVFGLMNVWAGFPVKPDPQRR